MTDEKLLMLILKMTVLPASQDKPDSHDLISTLKDGQDFQDIPQNVDENQNGLSVSQDIQICYNMNFFYSVCPLFFTTQIITVSLIHCVYSSLLLLDYKQMKLKFKIMSSETYYKTELENLYIFPAFVMWIIKGKDNISFVN